MENKLESSFKENESEKKKLIKDIELKTKMNDKYSKENDKINRELIEKDN